MDPPSLARSLHCFRATDNRPRPQQARSRAKYTPEEREKVNKVRQRGACLRCRMLRIRCSQDNPCKSCLESALRGSERKVLSFCYCIRSRYSDVNIFYSDQIAVMQIETLSAKMGGLLSRVALPASFTSFDLEQRDKFNDTLETWLTDPGSKFPNGSIVALCCSNLLSIHFQEELLDDDLLPEFQKFLLATTLAHSGWHARDMKRRELCAAGHVSGYRLIKRLDRILTPQFLSQCSPEYCQVLFLLLLGTILGVGYSSTQLTDSDPSPSFPAAEMLDTEFQQSPTLWLAMKEHLCQMLAHHLIYLASMLGIKLDTDVERRIIDTAIHRWSKMESYVWADGVESTEAERDAISRDTLNRRRAGFTMNQTQQQQLPQIQPSPQLEPHPQIYDQYENPPYWQDGPEPQMDTIPRKQTPLVPIPCEDLAQFTTDFPQWSENPESYMSMEMDEPPEAPETESSSPSIYGEPESMQMDYSTSRTTAGSSFGPVSRSVLTRSHTEPIPQSRQDYSVPWRRIKRRSMWVVRTFDGGHEHGAINVQARLRGREVPRDFGLFV
ncbi:hypothetical protein V8F06_009173 [Rhypophila decipiens]